MSLVPRNIDLLDDPLRTTILSAFTKKKSGGFPMLDETKSILQKVRRRKNFERILQEPAVQDAAETCISHNLQWHVGHNQAQYEYPQYAKLAELMKLPDDAVDRIAVNVIGKSADSVPDQGTHPLFGSWGQERFSKWITDISDVCGCFGIELTEDRAKKIAREALPDFLAARCATDHTCTEFLKLFNLNASEIKKAAKTLSLRWLTYGSFELYSRYAKKYDVDIDSVGASVSDENISTKEALNAAEIGLVSNLRRLIHHNKYLHQAVELIRQFNLPVPPDSETHLTDPKADENVRIALGFMMTNDSTSYSIDDIPTVGRVFPKYRDYLSSPYAQQYVSEHYPAGLTTEQFLRMGKQKSTDGTWGNLRDSLWGFSWLSYKEDVLPLSKLLGPQAKQFFATWRNLYFARKDSDRPLSNNQLEILKSFCFFLADKYKAELIKPKRGEEEIAKHNPELIATKVLKNLVGSALSDGEFLKPEDPHWWEKFEEMRRYVQALGTEIRDEPLVLPKPGSKI